MDCCLRKYKSEISDMESYLKLHGYKDHIEYLIHINKICKDIPYIHPKICYTILDYLYEIFSPFELYYICDHCRLILLAYERYNIHKGIDIKYVKRETMRLLRYRYINYEDLIESYTNIINK